MTRAIIPQPVHDALGEYIFLVTALRPWRAESNKPRPSLPYVGFEIRSQVALSSPLRQEYSDSIASAAFEVTVPALGYVVLLINGARFEAQRGVGESLSEVAVRLTAKVVRTSRGRCTATTIGATVSVLPVNAGDLAAAQVIEGATLVLVAGPAYRDEQNVYRTTVRVQLFGLPYGATGGTLGDGKDIQTVATDLREALSTDDTKVLFGNAWARIIDAPNVPITFASATIGAQREVRATLDLTLGITVRRCLPSKVVSSVTLPATPVLKTVDDNPVLDSE